jgi:hypothetical protein
MRPLMKTIVGKVSVASALVMTLPLALCGANHPALQSASPDVSALTLLRGPNLTSPVVPLPVRKNDSPAPQVQVGAASGTLTLSRDHPDNTIVVPPLKKRLPPPESLRFENQLHAPATSPHSPTIAPGWKFIPAAPPKRD